MRFLAGDILVAASDVPDNIDLRNLHGPGRILHLDQSFQLKRTLATGTDGLVIGLAVDPLSGDLFAADARAKTVVRFGAMGSPKPSALALPRHKFGALAFGPDGQLLLGIHNLLGEEHSEPVDLLWTAPTADGPTRSWRVDFDGGKLKFHRISFLSPHPTGQHLLYVSENGRRVLTFDLVHHRQAADFLTLADNDPRGTYGLGHLPDGRVLMATGIGASLFSAEGEELHQYSTTTTRGWSRIALSTDSESFFMNNFLEGIVEHRRIDNGALIRSFDIQQRHALCGIVEYPTR